jgi:hypothetical protein
VAVLAVAMAANKSAGHRGRARNDEPNRLDEIIEEIVDNLRPWKRGRTGAAVTAEVKHEAELLVKIAPLQEKLFDRSRYREHAKGLNDALLKVENLVASCPSPLALLLFNPLPPIIEREDGTLTQEVLSLEEFERRYRARLDWFVTEVRRVSKVCSRAMGPGIGATHPNYDHYKHLCAQFAFGLMRGLSKNEATGTKDGAFRTVTSLLYQAISGERDADLKRACDKVLRWVK